MSGLCGALAGNLEADCNNLPQAGIEDTLYLINKSDIASITLDNGNALIATGITLISGALAFKVVGMNNSNSTKWDLVKLRYSRMYSHILSFIGFDMTASGMKQYDQLAKGKVVAIVINNFKGGSNADGAIRIYGATAGLVAETMGQDYASADTQGAVSIAMQSDSGNNIYEPKIPLNFVNTDFATAKAIIEALT